MNYEHKLVYVGEVDKYTNDGWEPVPQMNQVTKPGPTGFISVYLWLRKAK